jgi:anoctamin-10/anoctamin-7
MNDYAELAIQFGYMAFFVVALPIATAGAFINNYVEIRTDGFKLLRGVQRPLPNGAEDIGTWMSIFSIMSTICVVTNAGIIVFTMKVLDMYDITLRLWMFIGFQWFCFICQFIIQYAIPDEPLDVQIQIKRGEFIVNKLIRRTLDDTDEVADNQLKLDSSRISIAAKSPEFGA